MQFYHHHKTKEEKNIEWGFFTNETQISLCFHKQYELVYNNPERLIIAIDKDYY